MRPLIDDFSNELKVQVGNRVHVELSDVPEKDRDVTTGVIVAIRTFWVHTPKMRRFQIDVRFDGDGNYVKKSSQMAEGIGPIFSLRDQDKLTIISKGAKPMSEEGNCEWTYDENHCYYDTNCGKAYGLIDGTLKENSHIYCPYCGGKIKELNSE